MADKSVRLMLLGNNLDAKAKMDEVDARVEELKALHPELSIGLDAAKAQAEMKILRDDLMETADLGKTPIEVTVHSEKALAQLDLIKANADRLRADNPVLTPRINDMEASAQLAVLRGEITQTEAKAEGMGKAWEVTKYAMLGVAGAVGFGVYKASSFSSEMEKVHTQAGVAQSKIGGLSQSVLTLAGQVGEDPDSLAEALYHVESNMGSMGATSTQVMSAVKVAAQGAKVGGANLVDVTNALGAAIASGIPGVQNYQEAMGSLNATVGAGDMTMQNLAEAMGTGFLANVKMYGTTLNDVGAILATYGDNNIRGANAGTQLRMAVQALAVQASTAAPYLKELGLQAGELGKYQSVHGTVQTVGLVVSKLKEAGIAQSQWGNIITEMFGKKAGSGIGVLIDQYDRLDSKTKAVAAGSKTFGSAVKANSETAAQQFDRLKDGSEALATSMGLKLLPAAIKIEGFLANVVTWLTKNSAGFIGLAGVITAIFAGLALKKLEDGVKGAIEGFEGLYKNGKNVLKFITDLPGKLGILKGAQEAETIATGEAAEAQESLNLAFLTSPIGLIVIGITALIVIFVELWKHCAAFRDFWKAAWKDITAIAEAAFNWVKHNWPLILGILLGPIALAAALIATHWHQIVSGAESMFHKVVGFFSSLPAKIRSALGDLGHLLLDAGKDLISGLIHGIENSIPGLTGALHFVTNLIPFHKGPPSVDAALLRPSGQLIMGGLVKGLDDGTPALTRQLQGTTNLIAGTRFTSATSALLAATRQASAATSQPLQIEWVGGAGADRQFLAWLKQNIRINGGNPAVLGR